MAAKCTLLSFPALSVVQQAGQLPKSLLVPLKNGQVKEIIGEQVGPEVKIGLAQSFMAIPYYEFCTIKETHNLKNLKLVRRLFQETLPFLDDRRLEEFVRCAHIQFVNSDEVVLRRGEKIEQLIFVESGELVARSSADLRLDKFYPKSINRGGYTGEVFEWTHEIRSREEWHEVAQFRRGNIFGLHELFSC